MAGLADRADDSTAEQTAASNDHRKRDPNDDRSRLGGASILVAAGAFVLLGGAPGVAAAAALVAVWFLLPATYAFALGNVALAALVGSSNLVALAVVEAGLFGVLLAPAGYLDRPGRPVAIAAGGAAVGVALAWAASRGTLGLPLAGLGVIAATGLGGYGLHRSQLAALDPVGDERE